MSNIFQNFKNVPKKKTIIFTAICAVLKFIVSIVRGWASFESFLLLALDLILVGYFCFFSSNQKYRLILPVWLSVTGLLHILNIATYWNCLYFGSLFYDFFGYSVSFINYIQRVVHGLIPVLLSLILYFGFAKKAYKPILFCYIGYSMLSSLLSMVYGWVNIISVFGYLLLLGRCFILKDVKVSDYKGRLPNRKGKPSEISAEEKLLVKLRSEYERGLWTEEEYKEKRKQILSTI